MKTLGNMNRKSLINAIESVYFKSTDTKNAVLSINLRVNTINFSVIHNGLFIESDEIRLLESTLEDDTLKVNAYNFLSTLKAIKDAVLLISYDDSNLFVHNNEIRIPIPLSKGNFERPDSEFARFESEYDVSKRVIINSYDFNDVINQMEFIIDKKEVRPLYVGIGLNTRIGNGSFYALDRHKLCKMDRVIECEKEQSFFIPLEIIKLIQHLTKNKSERVIIDTYESRLRIRVGYTIIWGYYECYTPDYEHILSMTYGENTITFNKGILEATIRDLISNVKLQITNGNHKKSRFDFWISLVINDSVAITSHQFNNISKTINYSYQQPIKEVEINIEAYHLFNFLKNSTSDEVELFYTNDKYDFGKRMNPISFRTKNAIYIVMPVKGK